MTEQWIVAGTGGPSGPFWSIVSSSGRVIAMQIPDEAVARQIVDLQAELDRRSNLSASIVVDQLRTMEQLRSQVATLIAERDDLAAKYDEIQAAYAALMISKIEHLRGVEAERDAAQEENHQLRQHIASLETSSANLRTLARAASEELNQMIVKRKRKL